MINYLLEFSLLFGFFGICYLLFIKQLNAYNFTRHYLVGTTLFSVALPLIPNFSSETITVFSQLLPSVEVVAQGIQQETIIEVAGANITFNLILWMYAVISIFLLFRFFHSSINLLNIFRNGKHSTLQNRKIIFSEKIKNPCSFFRYILLPMEMVFDEQELSTIIKHESLHIDLDHSSEKVFFNAFKIFCWWHPTSWLYNKEIELVHELQVDEQMSQQMNPKKYAALLLQLIINPPQLRMTNSFSSHIKKRLQIMNQKKNKPTIMHLCGLVLFLFAGTFFIHSCTQSTEAPYSSKVDDVNVVAMSSQSSDKFYETVSIDTFTTFNMETYEETIEIAETTMKVYKEPETMAMFPGCETSLPIEELKECSTQKLLQFIYTNITYPAEAREKGIEGMILIKFIVGKEGWVGNPEFVKTLGHGMEETVKEMMVKMQKEYTWIPGTENGENVNVEFTLPIKFKLEG